MACAVCGSGALPHAVQMAQSIRRASYRRALLNTAIARGTWGDAPIPPDLLLYDPATWPERVDPGATGPNTSRDPQPGS
jgi:hypothetical protein